VGELRVGDQHRRRGDEDQQNSFKGIADEQCPERAHGGGEALPNHMLQAIPQMVVRCKC